MSGKEQDARSEEGLTVGMIDGAATFLRALATRDLSTKNAQEALADLTQDPAFRTLLDASPTAGR